MFDAKNYFIWYNNVAVKYEIIKQLFNRELVVLVPTCYPDLQKKNTRMLKCHSVQHFDFIMKKGLRVFQNETPYNLYYSLARYIDGIPEQTFNLAERNNSLWLANQHRYIGSYDLLIDVDAPSHEFMDMAFLSAKSIKKHFDKLKIPYELRFSGCGFHFIIHKKMFDASFDPYKDDNYYKRCYDFAKNLNELYSEFVDLNIYDSRRVCKIPYTLSIYKNAMFVCYPFHNDKEFNSFKLQDYAVENFIKLPDIDNLLRNRGLYIFNGK